MDNYVVDFETFYDTKASMSVGDLGLKEYARLGEAYIVSVVGPGEKWVGEVGEAVKRYPLGWWQDPAKQFWAANSNFDQTWVEKYWPYAEFQRPWKCVLDLGNGQQLPRDLQRLVKTALHVDISKDLRKAMDGRHWEDQGLEDRKALLEYCLSDSVYAHKLLSVLTPLSPTEDAIAEQTRRMNRRGVRIDADRLAADRTKMSEARHNAFLRLPWRNDAKPLSAAALADWCRVENLQCPLSLDKTDPECTRLMAEQPRLAEVIGAMRMYRRCNTLGEKAAAVERRMDMDGVIPLEFIYCGAPHTRRWSCRGVNVQNLDREPLELPGPVGGDPITVWSRQWVVPRPGKCFLILDLSQIEPRCLNWLVGNDELLQAVASGYSVYEAFATMTGAWSGAPGSMKSQWKAEGRIAEYTLLKNKCLGCGYGMGGPRFADYAGVDIKTANVAVAQFRQANKRITKLWEMLDVRVRAAALDKTRELVLELPTGEPLKHFSVRANKFGSYQSYTVRGDFSATSLQSSLWGGTLTENLCQRMSRDIFAEALLRLEAAGFAVCFHAHDEVILEVDSSEMALGEKSDALREASRLMCVTPEWCQGLPLNAEGGFDTAYSK